MKTVTVDFTGCRYYDDFHERIRKAFDFPEYYGKNWNAFWDLMWSECDADKIIILGEDTLPKNFLPQCEIMHRLIEDAAEERKKYGENELTYIVVKG